MLKKLLLFGLVAAVVGSAVGVYLWNKPHASIGKPDFVTTATALAAEFSADEDAATKKYVGSEKMVVVQVSGKIAEVQNDTSGISILLDTGDPLNGVSCVLDKYTKQPRTDYKVGEEVALKGVCTGKLTDVVIDRCVPAE